MGENCKGCGVENKVGSIFCENCGATLNNTNLAGNYTFENQVAQTPPQQQVQIPPPATVPPQQQPMHPQSYSQTQSFTPVQPKSTKKWIAGVVVIIVAVIAVVLIYFLLFSSGVELNSGVDSAIVGTWGYTDTSTGESLNMIWKFKSDGTVEAGSEIAGTIQTMKIGIYRTEGNQLCITVTNQLENCYTYSINGNQLTWEESGLGTLTLTKR